MRYTPPMLLLLALLSLPLVAQAETPETPWMWTRVGLGAGLWPSGLQLDARAQARTPLYKTESFLLADNYAGAGLRAAVTPAYVNVGPRLSIAPAAFFDMDVQGSFIRYFHTSFGPLPFDQLESGKPDAARDLRADESFATNAFYVSAEPTLKAQVGPIVAFDAWTIEARRMEKPESITAPYVYEPYWDLVLAWDDVIIEQQGAVMAMIWKGDGVSRKFWIGATVRHHWAVRSTDSSLVLGGVLLLRADRKFLAGPQLIVQVLPYVLDDADMKAGPPNIQLQISYEFDTPFRASP